MASKWACGDNAAGPSSDSGTKEENICKRTNGDGDGPAIKQPKVELPYLLRPKFYDILPAIFKRLAMYDLKSVNDVCPLWEGFASPIIRSRRDTFDWAGLFRHLNPTQTAELCRNFANPRVAYEDAFVKEIPGTDTAKKKFVDISDILSIYAQEEQANFIQEYYQNLLCSPQLTISFTCDTSMARMLHMSLVEKPREETSVLSVVSRKGVIVTPRRPNGWATVECEVRKSGVGIFSIPKNDSIRPYVITYDESAEEGEAPGEEDEAALEARWERIASRVVEQFPDHERGNVKGILAFSVEGPEIPAKVYRKFMNGRNESIAFCGALTSLLDFDDANEDITAAIVFICGDDRLQVHSFVLPEDVAGKAKVAAEMANYNQLIRAKMPRKPKSGIAIQCACLGRGRLFHRDWNVEANAFRDSFPEFPLFGTFGDGELGTSSLSEPAEQSTAPLEWQYSTAFMIISLF